MSGIDKIKEKIKQKMTLDDFPSPKPALPESVNTATHIDVQTDLQIPPPSSMLHADTSPPPYVAHNTVHPQVQQYSIADVQQKVEHSKKMTMYLTAFHYKAFNDIYAQRMIDGCPTQKSELICEAIDLLQKKEKGLLIEYSKEVNGS